MSGEPEAEGATVEGQLSRLAPAALREYQRIAPSVVQQLGGDFRGWVERGTEIARGMPGSAEAALEYFRATPSVLAVLPGAEFRRWGELGRLMAARSPGAGSAYFRLTPEVLARTERRARPGLLSLLEAVGQRTVAGAALLIAEVSAAIGQVPHERHAEMWSLVARVADVSSQAAAEYMRSFPHVSSRLEGGALLAWQETGETLAAANEEAGVSYFRLRSREALERLSELSTGIELNAVREVLRLYCKALTGRAMEVLAADELVSRGVGWTSVEQPTTDGTAVFAPPVMQLFPSQAENFEAYKVLATHQAGHLEWGTFDFSFERKATRFADLRPHLAASKGREATYLADFQRFFDLFSDRSLARDLFTVAEDCRVDSAVRAEYSGIRAPYARLQQQTLTQRQAPAALPQRQAAVEALVQLSLDAPSLTLPQDLAPVVERAGAVLRRLRTPEGTTVEDSAEAAIRLYTLVAPLPNVSPEEPGAQEEVDPSQGVYEEPDTETAVEQFLRADQVARERGEELDYEGLDSGGFRGELKPELVQTILSLRQNASSGVTSMEKQPLPTQLLRDMLERSVEVPQDWIAGEDMEGLSDEFLDFLMEEWVKDGLGTSEADAHRLDDLGEPEAQAYVYDEWDYRTKSYRHNWVTLWERRMRQGESDYFDATVRQYPQLVAEVEKQFELLRPERLGRLKRLIDGEEFDLDAVVESTVEKRAGTGASEKIYSHRRKVQRDVAVALLLDMSVSTQERIELDSMRAGSAGTVPGGRLRSKRIVDLEKESLVLLIRALERIGDTYAIFGFSGRGRENAQFFVVKNAEEAFSEEVKRRIDRIAPAQGTRMGPAIRHATAKLAELESKTRILILLSDGRPQDTDYGSEWEELSYRRRAGVPAQAYGLQSVADQTWREREYAVHDTRMALLEARAKAITPFCISVDKAGHDYLRTMCGDIGYEVVSDIESLPKRLPALYRRLTT